MGARFINNDGTPIKKVVGAKKQYENINGVFVPVFYDGYILYNSLTTDGSSWIDLGHVGDSTHRYELDFSFDKKADTNNYGIFGDRVGDMDREIAVYWQDNGFVNIRMRNGQSTRLDSPQSEHNRFWGSISSTKYEIIHNGNYLTRVNQINSNFVTPHNLTAFKLGGLAPRNFSFHSIKEYGADGTLLYGYVSAKRQSDNVLGLLEVVNGTFYANAGSGSFSV